MSSTSCSNCGAVAAPEDVFCTKCGERLATPVEAQGPSSVSPTTRPMRFQDIFDPSGRFTRSQFALTYFGGLALGLLSVLVDGLLGLGGLSLLYFVGFAYVVIAAGIRRLHDTGNSGWLILLAFAPLANIFMILYLLFAPGTRDRA
ncbi:MAG: DUF805 domain-containing protein [Chloroflexi bacterium]|nr:DUF805 domain-containing protein [Chloroflexota bacterium]